MAVALVLTSTVLLLAATLAQLCVNIEQEQRFNCLPDMQPDDVNEETCQQRDCCFSRAPENAIYRDQVPSCFYPVDYATYMVDNFTETSYGYSATLQFSGESGARFPLPNVVETLSLQLYFYPVSKFIRVKIFDPANPRYQVPDAYPASNREEAVFSSLFPTEVNMNGKSVVVRDELDLLLLDFSVAPLIFTDQFIQISLSTGSEYAYGFEQGNDVFAKPMNTWRKYIFSSHWNYYEPNGHPFGMFMRKEKSSFGMFLLNSNAMEIELTPCPALTYRTKGGIIDLFIYAGATPDAVVKQHLQVVGMPLMPPYWALGLHLNGFAATGENEEAAGLWSFVESQKKDEIPHDSLILDVDACTEQNKWTKGLGLETLQSHISKLHKRNVRLVLTDNPVVSEELVTGEEELFVKDGTSTAVGNSSVCDSSFAVLDYTNENATASWWATALASSKRNSTAIDGLRLDNDDLTELGMDFSCGTSVYDARFIPGKIEESEKLYLTAGHAAGPNYNLHTLRGHFHAKVANKVLQMLHPTKRPFILTRSLFAGTGKYAHLWINDVPFDWKAITDLVNPLLNLNLFGMPLVGTELCKSSSVEDELCQRWNQLVVFYPFMTYKHQIDEDETHPNYWFVIPPNSVNKVKFRYELLPYYYTLHWRASTYAETVVRPLFLNFPDDRETWGIDRQFMIGGAILVCPVLEYKVTTVPVYFPIGRWYSWSGEEVKAGRYTALTVDLNRAPLFILGGHIVPIQVSGVNTEQTRQRPHILVVALDNSNSAKGELYIDKGDSDRQKFLLVKFTVSEGTLCSTVTKSDYNPLPNKHSPVVRMVRIFGVRQKPTAVRFNNKLMHYFYNYSTKRLDLHVMETITRNFVLSWGNNNESAFNVCGWSASNFEKFRNGRRFRP